MAQLDFELFRIKFIRPGQISTFHDDTPSSELFEKILFDKPSIKINSNNIWHIGNIQQIGNDYGTFAIGKTTTVIYLL